MVSAQSLLWEQNLDPGPWDDVLVGAIGRGLFCGLNTDAGLSIDVIRFLPHLTPVVLATEVVGTGAIHSFGAANSRGTCAVLADDGSSVTLLLPTFDFDVLAVTSHPTSLPVGSTSQTGFVSQDGLELVTLMFGTWYGVDLATGATNWSWTSPGPAVVRTVIGAPRVDRQLWRNTSPPTTAVDSEATITEVSHGLHYTADFTGVPTAGIISITLTVAVHWVALFGAYPDPGGSVVADGSVTLTPELGTGDTLSLVLHGDLTGAVTGPAVSVDLELSYGGIGVWVVVSAELEVLLDNSAAGGGHYELRDGAGDLLSTLSIDTNAGDSEGWIDTTVDAAMRARWNSSALTAVTYRPLRVDGDTLAWAGADADLAVDWTPDATGVALSAWAGQVALTPTGAGGST